MREGLHNVGVSLDELISAKYTHKHVGTSVEDLRDKIQKYKERTDRFAHDDEEMERRQGKLHRMQKKLEWTEHKAPPLPIVHESVVQRDSLYLYGVDFMSTDDVKKYFARYVRKDIEPVEGEESLSVVWINDSSCVIKLQSEALALKAYTELRLTEARTNEQLPPLETYIVQQREAKKLEQQKKVENPDYEDLFAQEEVKEEDVDFD